MTSARLALSEVLKLELPKDKYRIIPAAHMPDNVTRPTVIVWQENARRHDQIGHDRLALTLTVWLLVGNEDIEKAESELEDGFEDIVKALQPVTWAWWDEAERLTYGKPGGAQFHAYRFNLTSINKIGD